MVSERAQTAGHAWRARARTCASVSDGAERFSEKSAERSPRFKTVRFEKPARTRVSLLAEAGLTDYEIRDLNDEINKLIREKRHWENQLVALGGANYRRSVAMLDDDGKEVPSTKGYKFAVLSHGAATPH